MDRHGFYWLIEGALAGCGRPGKWSRRDGEGADLAAATAALDDDLRWLRGHGIGAVLTLTETPLLPGALAKVHPTRRTPWIISIIVTVVVAVLAGFTPVGVLEEMVNIGTLSAFVLVSIGVVVLRRTRPDLKRGFRVPWSPLLPILSAAICTYLMLNLTVETWLRFLIWLVIGFVIYFSYSRGHSRLGKDADTYLNPAQPHVVTREDS